MHHSYYINKHIKNEVQESIASLKSTFGGDGYISTNFGIEVDLLINNAISRLQFVLLLSEKLDRYEENGVEIT